MTNSAVLLISCPDRKGIVASVANFLYTYNANILHADEHIDTELGLFFLRTEWDLSEFSLDMASFSKAFVSIAEKFSMKWKLAVSSRKSKVGVFVSKELHCLSDLLYRNQAGDLPCEISVIISNHEDAKGLAAFYGIPFIYIPVAPENKHEAELQALHELGERGVDVIVLARYMQILSSNIIDRYPQSIINIHHSFLPSFIGAKPYHQAYARGVKLIGATAHFVTSELDQGPIIEQDILRVSHRDAPEDLVQKGKDIEKTVLSRAVKWQLENKILVYANKTVIFD